MWLQWLARVMEPKPATAGAAGDPGQTAAAPEVAELASEFDIAAAEDAISLFDELARAPVII